MCVCVCVKGSVGSKKKQFSRCKLFTLKCTKFKHFEWGIKRPQKIYQNLSFIQAKKKKKFKYLRLVPLPVLGTEAYLWEVVIASNTLYFKWVSTNIIISVSFCGYFTSCKS